MEDFITVKGCGGAYLEFSSLLLEPWFVAHVGDEYLLMYGVSDAMEGSRRTTLYYYHFLLIISQFFLFFLLHTSSSQAISYFHFMD